MTPRTEEQFHEIRESKKALIMETALELFATEGYHRATISSIAGRAGISKGLMYNYFESKEDLIIQIMRLGIDHLLAIFDPDHDGELTEDEIKYFVDQLFALMSRNIHFWKIYFMVLLQPAVYRLIETEIEQMIRNFLNILTGYLEKKGFEDPDTEARMLGALIDGLAFQYILNPDSFPVEKIKNRIINMYC